MIGDSDGNNYTDMFDYHSSNIQTQPQSGDYDYEGAKAAGVQPDARGHLPDTYKLPNHITFSDESIHNKDGGAGHWEQLEGDHWGFTPGATNLKNHSMDELRDYFKKYEPDSTLIEPKQDNLSSYQHVAGNNPDVMGKYAPAIREMESSGQYGQITDAGKGRRALGAYQVMEESLPEWTKSALGKSLTTQEFLSDKTAQDKVFEHQFGGYVQKYGNPQDAASAWFTGKPQNAQSAQAKDVLGTSGAGYVAKFNRLIGNPQQEQPYIDKDHHVPLVASALMTNDGQMYGMAVDHRMNFSDDHLDLLFKHEQTELSHMQNLIAGGMSNKEAYEEAHDNIATPTETAASIAKWGVAGHEKYKSDMKEAASVAKEPTDRPIHPDAHTTKFDLDRHYVAGQNIYQG